jgi:hypothetical protein
LLKDALPDFSIREAVKPVIAESADKIRVYETLDQLPEQARVVAKARNDGKFQISEKDLLASTGLTEIPEGDPGKPAPKHDACRRSRSRSRDVAAPGGMAACQSLREKASAAGQSVRVID